MADTLASNTSDFGHEGSTPSSPTKSQYYEIGDKVLIDGKKEGTVIKFALCNYGYTNDFQYVKVKYKGLFKEKEDWFSFIHVNKIKV